MKKMGKIVLMLAVSVIFGQAVSASAMPACPGYPPCVPPTVLSSVVTVVPVTTVAAYVVPVTYVYPVAAVLVPTPAVVPAPAVVPQVPYAVSPCFP